MRVPPNDATYRGVYGDSFGSLAALLSALTMGGLVITLYIQITEAIQTEKRRLQEDEVRQKEETKRAEEDRKHEEESIAALQRRDRERYEDNFENRFFRLFGIWRSYVDSLEKTEGGMAFRDTDSHPYTIRGMQVLHQICQPLTLESHSANKSDYFIYTYKEIYKANHDILAPYFRTLYHTFRYISRSQMQNKEEYSDIVRAILSPIELFLVAGTCFTDEGKNFKRLVEEFHLLKHLPQWMIDLLLDTRRFESRAFEL